MRRVFRQKSRRQEAIGVSSAAASLSFVLAMVKIFFAILLRQERS
jgi:hypothetical protein